MAILTYPTIEDCNLKNIYSKKGKFNKALELAVDKYRYHHIMYIETVNEVQHFNSYGRLMARGKTDMWYEVIHQLKLFDAGEIQLRPRISKLYKSKGDGDVY